jgi:hypothetical protein
MPVLRLVVAIIVAWLAVPLLAHAGERDQLNACQALVDRAPQSPTPGAASAGQDDPEIQRCRQIIKEWTLRDSRRSVDEHGRPLR